MWYLLDETKLRGFNPLWACLQSSYSFKAEQWVPFRGAAVRIQEETTLVPSVVQCQENISLDGAGTSGPAAVLALNMQCHLLAQIGP